MKVAFERVRGHMRQALAWQLGVGVCKQCVQRQVQGGVAMDRGLDLLFCLARPLAPRRPCSGCATAACQWWWWRAGPRRRKQQHSRRALLPATATLAAAARRVLPSSSAWARWWASFWRSW